MIPIYSNFSYDYDVQRQEILEFLDHDCNVCYLWVPENPGLLADAFRTYKRVINDLNLINQVEIYTIQNKIFAEKRFKDHG